MPKRLYRSLSVPNLILVASFLAIPTEGMHAAEIRFLCAAALRPAMDELLPAFQRSSGHTVDVKFANVRVNAESVRSGEPADLAVVSPELWGDLQREDKLDAGTRAVIAKVGLGVFVRKGATRPSIESTEAFRSAFLKAGSIAIPLAAGNPVGAYAVPLFDRLGLTAELERKNAIKHGGSPLQAVAKGDAEIGFTQISEVVAASDVEFVGPLPAEIQNFTTFVAAIPKNSNQLSASQALIEFLLSPTAISVFRSRGLE